MSETANGEKLIIKLINWNKNNNMTGYNILVSNENIKYLSEDPCRRLSGKAEDNTILDIILEQCGESSKYFRAMEPEGNSDRFFMCLVPPINPKIGNIKKSVEDTYKGFETLLKKLSNEEQIEVEQEYKSMPLKSRYVKIKITKCR